MCLGQLNICSCGNDGPAVQRGQEGMIAQSGKATSALSCRTISVLSGLAIMLSGRLLPFD